MKTAGKTFPVSSVAVEPTTGQSYTSFYDIFTIGAGYVDAAAALADYEGTFLSSVSPNVTYNPSSQKGSLALPATSNWRWSSEWSPTAVWGNIVLPNGTTIWNSSYAWSSSNNWGTSIAWGTNGPGGSSIAQEALADLAVQHRLGHKWPGRLQHRLGHQRTGRIRTASLVETQVNVERSDIRAALVRFYLFAIVTLGSAIFLWAFVHWRCDDPLRFASFLIAGVIASILKIRLPGVTETFSVSVL